MRNINVTLTQQDFKTYSHFAFQRAMGKSKRGDMLLFFLLGMVSTILFLFLLKQTPYTLKYFHWPTALVVAFFFIFIFSVYIYAISKQQKRTQPEQSGISFLPQEISFSNEGIKEKSLLHETTFSWLVVKEIIEFKGNVYIFIDKMQAIVFPSSCFSDDMARQQFIKQLNEYIQKSKENRLR